MSPRLREGATALAVVTGLLAAPSIAAAAPVAFADAGGCKAGSTAKSFAKVDGDAADYSVAPGGDFEAAGSWTLANGAKIVSGNESLGVATGTHSLSLPVGATATSPKFCIDATNPDFRFVFKANGLGAGFLARIIYQTASGVTTSQLFSSQQLKAMPTSWQASPRSPLSTLLPLLGGSATVQIQLVGITLPVANTMATVSALMTGGLMALPGVSVDSVMVDPYRRS